MNRLAFAALVFVAACGGSSKPPASSSTTPPAAADPAPTTTPSVAQTPAKPPVGDAKPSSGVADAAFLTECRGHLAQAKAEHQKILAAQDKRTIENTFETFNELSRHISNAGALAGLFQSVSPEAKIRDAARTCETEVSQFISELLLDRKVYDALAAVDVKAADANTKRFALVTLREYKRAGVALDDAKRARIKAIDDEITTIGQQISKNIAEDTRYIEVPVAEAKARLAGMPQDWIDAHKPEGGKIRISTDYPDSIPFSTYADDDALRKELYIKFRARGDKDNEGLLQKLLVLRAEKAKMLGFKDWADYQSDDKMLKGGKAAAAFVDRITKLAQKRAKQDYAELLAQLKKQDAKATTVGDWQRAYLENKVKKEKYAVDAEVVRQYFPFDKSLAGLLDITSAMYDIQYVPVTDAKVWHADVKVYDVMRKDQKLGRIFLDMHPRADKYKHAAQFTYKDGVAGKQLPEGVLVCNFPSGTNLMEHEDVVTMFHEFGHLMHHVLGGQQKWVRQTGTATELDFVEAPSQMFEEWGWNHDTLSRFAKHAKTGETIPKELVTKMRKADKFGLGTQTLQQMFYASISLKFHQADPAKLDQLAMVKDLQTKITPFGYVEGTRFHTSFGHLVGYSSMYYTYMWSLVIAKDLLTPFQRSGNLLDTSVTYRYRDKILAAGGTKDAADLVRDFLGRKYDFKAFGKYLSEN
ncbi:MAG TPA: M3 family metallopeptidase [Kofleriaceae bacterium]|nr:M3 family metallopeptidase [Kofleriaceae bacterium]